MKIKSLVLVLSIFFFNSILTAQVINIVRFNNTATYYPGGSISIHINPAGIFDLNNVFYLDLSDASGNFAASPNVIATVNEFFTPIINATIPSGTPTGTGYKLRIRASTTAATSATSNAFSIAAAPSPTLAIPDITLSGVPLAQITCLTTTQNPPYLGWLNQSFGVSTSNRNLNIVSASNAETYTVTLIDNSSGTPAISTLSVTNGQLTFPAGKLTGYYVLEVQRKANNSNQSTVKSFVYHFNTGLTNLGNSSSETVCVNSNVLFTIDIENIKYNYPGSKYIITYGDGTQPETYTHAQLLSNPALSHTFTETTCSSPNARQNGSSGYFFKVDIKLLNKGIGTGNCDTYSDNGNGTTKWVNSSKPPVADFTAPTYKCINSSFTVINTTTDGAYGTGSNCLNAMYTVWKVKKPGQSTFTVVSEGVGKLDYTFPAADVNVVGCWVIQLEVSNLDGCLSVSSIEKTVGVEPTPAPNFKILKSNVEVTTICNGETVTLKDQSNLLGLQCQNPTYSWGITPNSGFTFTSNTNSSSQNPVVTFSTPGTYTITQNITNSCGTYSIDKPLIVNGAPTVSIPTVTNPICKFSPADTVLDFGITGLKPTYSTGNYAPSSFLWEVNGSSTPNADWSFSGGTTSASEYPKILLKTYRTYSIKVTVNGGCGNGNATYSIILRQKPKITNTPIQQELCSKATSQSFNLTSDMANTSFNWITTISPSGSVSGVTATTTGTTIPGSLLTNTTAGVGTVTFAVTATNNGCSSNQDFNVFVYPNPAAPITSPVSLCMSQTASQLNATALTGHSLLWYTVATGGTSSSTAPTPTTTTAGSTTYYVSQASNTSPNCESNRASLVATVSQINTATAPSANPTLCSNTALSPNITITTTGATGIGTSTGLPAGLAAAWSGNTITVSGTPTAAGTFNYSIPLSGGCGSITATGTITVTSGNTATAPSASPTLCINTALSSNITITTTGATGIGTATGLPSGVTASWSNNTITISGTPTASGTFNYSIPLSGGCGSVTATGTITVIAMNTASATTSLNTCVNVALSPNITITTSGATGIGAATGLPNGLTASWNSNTITISGTPTATGTFNYSIPLAGGCGVVSATGTITVLTTNTAGAPSANPTLCINASLTPNITIVTTGATGIGSPTGLPSGVNANWTNNSITISGTPSVAGTFNYSIPLTGGCGSVNATGTITVLSNTVTSTSTDQSLCINTALSPDITFTTTGATGIGSATGLPAGVSALWNNNTITISGSPTAAGTFNYSIPLSGGCGLVTATGTITVIAKNTASATTSLNTCVNVALSPNITITTSGATGIGAATGLPNGLTASWNSNTITISGTPTATGTFNYSIPLTGGCGVVNATGTITVLATNTAAAPSTNPTICINTTLTPITHATSGATGIGTATGLPTGVAAAWNNNTITISGTPSVAGIFNYTIPLTGGCGVISATGTITVLVNTVTSASATPSACINTPLSSNITFTTTGATGIGTVSGLPAGLTALWNNNTITISGTPTAAGMFNYSIPLTGGCGVVNATGKITVVASNTATALPADFIFCINTALTPITHSTTGATGIGTATGLPTGVAANWNSNTITISGTPSVSGIFNYTIPLIGGCGTVSATGTITVTPDNTTAAPSDNPTICINTALTPITHATTGATGIGTATGLPTGVAAAWNSNTITISGNPSVAGVFNYAVPLTGGCGTISATGTITVLVNTVTSSSATPSLCINIAMPSDITFNTTGATGIGAPNNLPAGLTAIWNNNTITISGTPSATGTFNYTIPLTGGCGVVNAVGTITVVATNTAAAPSVNPKLCINTAISPSITIATTGATAIVSAIGLPTGVTATWNNNTITISGTPSVEGTFNYTIPLTGGCGVVSATGTITIVPDNTVTAPSSNPTLCINTPLTSITHATTGATGIGTATGLPTGITANWNSNTITISGTPSTSGTFNYTIPLTGGCGAISATGTIIVNADNTASLTSPRNICINTALTPSISITTTGATGIATATGLPVGLAATWSNNTITIAGTATNFGTFNYSIPLLGGCGTVNATGTIKVKAANTFGSASSNPTLCINAALTPITIATTGATGIGTPSGLPAGVTASLNGNTITVNGTPTVAGIFNYTIPLTGGCGTFNATGTITVLINTVTVASVNPSLCINSALSQAITFTTTGAAGIGTPTGLPAGVTAIWSNNTIMITGTPTVAGLFNYSIPLSGGCGIVSAAGTIDVKPRPIIQPATATICSGQTFTVSPANGNGIIVPTGTTYSWLSPITSGGMSGASGTGALISGTLLNATTIAQTATYTVTPSASNCTGADFTVVATVNPTPTISFSIADQTLCAGSASQEVTISSPTAGVTISWTSSFPSGLTALPNTKSGTTLIPSYIFTNSTATPITVSFVATVSTGGTPSCQGVGGTYKIIVLPTPPPPATQSLVEYCHNDPSSELTATAASPNTLIWYIPPNNSPSPTAPTPSTSIVGSFMYYVTQVSTTTPACESQRAEIEVRINPIPQIAVSAVAPTTCNSNNGVMTISGLFSNTSYGLHYVVNSVTINTTASTNLSGNIIINNLVSGIYKDIWVVLNNCRSNIVDGPFNLVNPDVPATPDAESNSPICEGETIQLNAISLTPNVTYAWTGPNGYNSTLQNPKVPNAPINSAGLYKVLAMDNGCNSEADSVNVVVHPNPIVDLGPDLQLLPPANQLLTPTITNGPISQYTWTPSQNLSCSNCPTPTATFISSIAYQLTVLNNNGCIGQDEIRLSALCEAPLVYIPNAFVPNGTVNSVFRIRSAGSIIVKNLRIFNRWGELIFERSNFPTNDAAYGWDGRINGSLPNPDVFVYTVEVQCDSGSTLFLKGNVTLLR